jgi:hypothetical protein
MVEGCASVVIGCSIVAGGGTRTVAGDVLVMETGPLTAGAWASKRAALAARRSLRTRAGRNVVTPARKVIVDADVPAGLACWEAFEAAIRAWWTA